MTQERNMQLANLFSTPILTYEVPSDLADKVENIFLTRQSDLNNMDVCYGDWWDEKGIFDFEKDLPDLFEEFIECKNAFYTDTGFKTDTIFQSWTQDYNKEGHSHPRHQHGINGISGVYWIRANEKASDLVFYNPNKIIDYITYDFSTQFNSPIYKIKPKKGTVVMFPSYIEHEVTPTPAGTIRTTIAFNFQLQPYQN